MAMTDLERELDAELGSQPSAQFYSILAGVFIVFTVFIIAPLLLFMKLRAMPQPAAVASTATATAAVPATTQPVASSIYWEASYESAMEVARQTGKPLMIDFYTDWCGVCKRLDAETFPAPSVIAESQNFVNVRVNAEVRTDLAQQHGVSSYPTVLFIDVHSNTLNRFAGGRSPSGFVQEMQTARSRLG